MRSVLSVFLTTALLGSPGLAQAHDRITLFDYPGATTTGLFAINDRGKAVGSGIVGTDVYPFVLDLRQGTTTDLSTVPGNFNTNVMGINNQGVTVGSIADRDNSSQVAYIRAPDGTFEFFSHPAATFQTEARGINEHGLISGWRDTPEGTIGFVYDTNTGVFADFAPSLVTIAHGINDNGAATASAIFFPEETPCPGGPEGEGILRFGVVRSPSGKVTYFQVNGQATRARDIANDGAVIGDVFDPVSGTTKMFISKIKRGKCVSLRIRDRELKGLAGYGLVPEGINDDGRIVGNANNPGSHGFIARRR